MDKTGSAVGQFYRVPAVLNITYDGKGIPAVQRRKNRGGGGGLTPDPDVTAGGVTGARGHGWSFIIF